MKTRVALPIGAFHDSAMPYRQALEAVGLEVRVLSSDQVSTAHDAVAAEFLSDVSGLLLAGGGDIDPLLMADAEHHPKVYGVDANRDRFERAVFIQAWRRELPILAVCRGMQVVNWVLGGTLYADIDDCCAPPGAPKRHRQSEFGHARHERTHPIAVTPQTLLHDILQADRVDVNSIHHQAICRVADGFTINAVAPDGVIEGMEFPQRDFVLAVQFHPEELWHDGPQFRRIFERFGQAALNLARH